MEEKKNKISLSVFISVIAVLVIIIMAEFIYMQKINANREIEGLKKDSEELKATVTELQGKLDSISNIADTSDTTANVSEKVFTDEEVKKAFSNYLELSAHAGCDSLLECLTEKGDIKYDSSKDVTDSDGKQITNVKFSDYKNAMLKYVSEREYEKNWSKGDHYSENNEGYIVKYQGGGGLRVYTIKSIKKTDNVTYSVKTTSVVDENEYYEENDYTFSIKNYNGHCVIDSITEQ